MQMESIRYQWPATSPFGYISLFLSFSALLSFISKSYIVELPPMQGFHPFLLGPLLVLALSAGHSCLDRMNILLVYFPNTENEKMKFLSDLGEELGKRKDIKNLTVMGDINFVEHELNIFLHRPDDQKVLNKWKLIKKKFKIIDGWRAHNRLERIIPSCSQRQGASEK